MTFATGIPYPIDGPGFFPPSKVVVFGHTHTAKIDKDSLFVKDRVYVNSGNWCGKEAHCVVVEPGDNGKTAASLLSIDSGGEIVADESRKIQV